VRKKRKQFGPKVKWLFPNEEGKKDESKWIWKLWKACGKGILRKEF